MSTIQNLKNFIRHGKQARQSNSPHGEATTNVSNVHAQQQRFNGYAPPPNRDIAQQHAAGISEPNMQQGHAVHHQHQDMAQGAAGGYSVAAGGNNKQQAARAGDAAAKAVDDAQARKAKKDVDPSVLERIVAEERESKGKMPRYPGLERWHLVEKMGDGAFSNVYRARDTEGKYPEVAIKVVRKFEMNSSQVSSISTPSSSSERARAFVARAVHPTPSYARQHETSVFVGRHSPSSRVQGEDEKGSQGSRGAQYSSYGAARRFHLEHKYHVIGG